MNDSKFPEVMVGAKLISTRDKELFLERSNNMEIEPLENGICTSASPNDAFPLISVLYRMLKAITKEDLVFFKNPGTSIPNFIFECGNDNWYHIYPNDVVEVLDNPFSEVGILELATISIFEKLDEQVKSPTKHLINKILVCSELVFSNGPMKTKKSIKVKSYTYRMKSDRFYVFVRKDDIEVIMNFFNKELKEFLRDKEVKPYSVDVFPEEAKRIVPKIKKMMSIENFSKLKNFGYPCQFGLILVGPPGLGKTVFVKYLRDVLHESELEYDEDMFSNIISYGIGDIHNLIGRNDDLPHRGLILLDDLDGAITERSSNDGVEGRHVLPWLLTQLDRFSDSQCNLHRLIVLCCNQLSYTDKALIRPGRFDRIIKFKELDNGVIRNMVDFVMKHDSDVNEKTKEEIIELFENQNPRISLANISLMGRLYYGGLVDSWIDAAIWSINRGDSEDKELILKSKNNKVGF